jgi:long-chain acyl-CoA synthetase
MRATEGAATEGAEAAAATAGWVPRARERRQLAEHDLPEQIARVDQLWPLLAQRHGAITALEAPHAVPPETYSYGELERAVSCAAAGLRRLGLREGAVVGLFAENSPRWLIVDQGLMRAGAADAVRGASAPVEELRYILEDSGAVGVVVQSAELWHRLALTPDQRSRLKVVVQLEGEPAEGLVGWEALMAIGARSEPPDPRTDRDGASAASTTATILYTSGTTGRPKGVPLSHANLLHQVRSLAAVARPRPGDPVLSVLPIWHAYERSAEYYFFSCGCSQTYTSIRHLKRDLPRVRPVIMVTVPRLWEAVQAGFDEALRGMPAGRQRLLGAALANSRRQRHHWRTARDLLLEPVPWPGRLGAAVRAGLRWPVHALASALLWPKVRAQLSGGQLAFPISGGGAIAPHVDAFFEAVGIELLVGYGLTETSPVVSCRRPWRNIRGSSGPPLPQTEFRIVDPENGRPLPFRRRGRVLVRGPQVMRGYLGKPDATAAVLDDSGWFDTGDLGMLLPDGSLVLTGRAKDTIVLSSGENVEPGPLEEALVASPLVEQVMLVGQDRRQLGALVVPHVAAMEAWAAAGGLILPDDPARWREAAELPARLRSELNRLLAARPGGRADERLGGVALVEPFTIENGLLTQTLKQRRDRISHRDAAAIEALYRR